MYVYVPCLYLVPIEGGRGFGCLGIGVTDDCRLPLENPRSPARETVLALPEDRPSPGCITMVFVTLVQLFALGFHLDWFREVKRQPVYAIVFL